MPGYGPAVAGTFQRPTQPASFTTANPGQPALSAVKAPPARWTLLGKRNLQPRGFTTGQTTATYRTKYTAGAAGATRLRMEFVAWSTSAPGTGDTPTGNPVTLTSVYVEQGATLTPVLFGGASSYTIPSGGAVTPDDLVVNVAPGATFYIRTCVTVTSGGQWPNLYGQPNYPDEVSRPGSNLANATGDLTGTGATFGPMYGPVSVFGDATTPLWTVDVRGDSRAAGTNDAFSDESQTGYWQRLLYAGQRPFRIVALPSESAAQYLTTGQATLRMALAGGVHWINEYGINDLQGGATLAQLQARIRQMAVATAGDSTIGRRYQQTLEPKSSGDFTTVAGQTTDGINAARVQFNDWVRDGMPESAGVAVATGTVGALRAGQQGHPYSGYFEIADLAESARNSGLWKAGYTGDGLHANGTGNAAIAAGIDTSQLVDVSSPAPAVVTPPPSGGSSSLTRIAASSPAIRSSPYQGTAASQAWASNSFSPVANSLIVVVAGATQSFNNAWNLPTITDSVGLTWARIDQQADVSVASNTNATVAVFVALCPAAQTGMTVTVTQSLAGSGQTIIFSSVDVHVFTGHDTTTPVASLAKGLVAANALSVPATPGGTAGSFLLLAGANGAAASGASSAGSGEYLASETHVGTSFATAWYGGSAGPTLTTTQQTLDLTGASARWQYIAFEVRGAAASGEAYTPSPADTVSGSDTTATALGAARTATDQVGLTDTATTAAAVLQSLADTAALADSTLVAAGVDRSTSDSAALTDAASASGDYARLLTDGTAGTDGVATTTDAARATSDSLGATDAAAVRLESISAGTDQVSATDSVALTTGTGQSASDNAALVDEASTAIAAPRQAAEAQTIVDNANTQADAVRGPADQASLSDTTSIEAGRGPGDGAGLTDLTGTTAAAARSSVDQAGITDSASAVLSGASSQTTADGSQLSDSVAAVLQRIVTADDLLAAIDQAGSEARRTASDPAALTDQAAAAQTSTRTVGDQVSVNDLASAILITAAGQAAADQLSVTDAALVTIQRISTNPESLALVDAVTVVLHRSITIADQTNLDDAASALNSSDLHDHTFTGHLEPRRWSGRLEPRRWDGALT